MTVTHNQIESIVLEFIAKDAMFTSVDIGNTIKERIGWIKNREVAQWLRANTLTLAPNYTMTLIDVNGGNVQAYLYHTHGSDPDDYQNRNQQALPPPPSQTITSGSATVRKMKIRSDSKGRLRIPAYLIQELGWEPGDTIDTTKIIVDNSNLNGNLIVHADGRIGIPRSCLSWTDGPVNVFVKNGNLCFEQP